MSSFPDQNQIQGASIKTREALGMPVGTFLSQEETSVFLKYLLLEGLEKDEMRSWRLRRKSDASILLRRRLKGLLAEIQNAISLCGELSVVSGIQWETFGYILSDSLYYRQRLIDVAMEAVLSEPLAPELCLQNSAATYYDFSATLSGSWNHAVIFSSPIFFTHEFYPLAVDAYVHDSELYGNPRINVLGAHINWLTSDGKLGRVLYVDFASGRLTETDLDIPIKADSAQFICLGRNEQEKHKTLSDRINCVQVNPYSVSMLADNKATTLAAWSALGLEVPTYQEITPSDLENAFDFFDGYEEVVVKPNQATEGELVTFFKRSHPLARTGLQYHLERCWEQGGAIVQQRRDRFFFRDPVSGTYHTMALRLNLAINRDGYHCLESGYAQLGQDTQSPAACGQGGHIIPIDEALSGLYCGSVFGNKPISLASGDWNRIRVQAERAASLFEGLMLVGLDILLDLDEHGKIIPVFLEANPRPAGLSHSRLLADDPLLPANIGVSLTLWDNLDQSRQSSRPMFKCTAKQNQSIFG
jgi:hypothetical protein